MPLTMQAEDKSTWEESDPREIQIAVPWGHIAGKAWGDPSGKHVLALHGFLDNAGSFDRLIPLLSKDLHIVAIDLPGHGHSSHRPKGSQYSHYMYVADVKYIVDALKWDRFMLMGHSLGAGVASWFAAALPERVEALILLDGFGFWSHATKTLPDHLGYALNNLDRMKDKNNRTYSWETAVEKILAAHAVQDKDFNYDVAAILAVRGTVQTEVGGYQFTRDLDLNLPWLLRVSHEVNSIFMKTIQCPTLLIRAENNSIIQPAMHQRLRKVMDHKILQVVKVPGGHHFHLCRPETIDKLVDSFLMTKTVPPSYHRRSKL